MRRGRRTKKEKEANIIEKERLAPTGGQDGTGGRVEGFTKGPRRPKTGGADWRGGKDKKAGNENG